MYRIYQNMSLFVFGVALSCSSIACKKNMARAQKAKNGKTIKVKAHQPPAARKKTKQKTPIQRASSQKWQGYIIGSKTPKKFLIIQQHPMIAPPRFGKGPKLTQITFTVVKNGKYIRQVLALFPDSNKPTDSSRPIEITGKASKIDLGGKRGKQTYKGLSVRVQSWKYVNKLP